jgi:hypothetical protein
MSARDDLREIVAFIAQDNPQAAVTFRDRLIAEAETLVRFPNRGRLMRRRGNVRKLVCRSYLILRGNRFAHFSHPHRGINFGGEIMRSGRRHPNKKSQIRESNQH